MGTGVNRRNSGESIIKHIIEVGGKEITLTNEEARELYLELKELFGKVVPGIRPDIRPDIRPGIRPGIRPDNPWNIGEPTCKPYPTRPTEFWY